MLRVCNSLDDQVKQKHTIRKQLNHCASNRNLGEAMHILSDNRANFDASMYNIVLNLAVGDTERFSLILQFMELDDVVWNTPTVAIVSSYYSMRRELTEAWRVIVTFEGKLSLRCYTPLIKSLGEMNYCDKILEVFQHMKSGSIIPTEREYIYLLKALSHSKREDDILLLLMDMSQDISECSTLLLETLTMCFDDMQDLNGFRRWQCQFCILESNNGCTSNGNKLESFSLNEPERISQQNSIRSLCLDDRIWNVMSKRLDDLVWDIVVDGANVGLTDGKNFNVLRVVEVVSQLEKAGWSVLVVLHLHHKRRCKSRESVIRGAWKYLDNYLFHPEPKMNDDWCWLYAAMIPDHCLVVSNDLMKDHKYLMSANSLFDKWRETHCVGFIPRGRCDITLLFPNSYARKVQTNQDCWFFPHIDSDKWLCVCPAT